MTDENPRPGDDQPVGLGAPPLGPGPSLEEEEKAMRAGKGGLIAILLAIVALIGAGLFFMATGGDSEAYEVLGQNVNGAKHDYFDAFWGCVFQQHVDIGGNEDLQREIQDRAARGGERFSTYVRRDCLEKLDDLEPRLRSLIPPDDMVTQVNALVAATGQLRGAWSDYLTWIDGLEGAYDRDAAAEKVRPVARGWFEYKTAHVELNRALAAALER